MGQFGPGVCPPECCRKAMSPSISAVSMGGKVVVRISFCRGVCKPVPRPDSANKDYWGQRPHRNNAIKEQPQQ
jgi:hypothetical protein